MSMTTMIHYGESIHLSASSISTPGVGVVAAFKLRIDTRYLGAADHVEITTFMNDVSSLEKLQRAADAFNAVMAEVEPAKEDAEAA